MYLIYLIYLIYLLFNYPLFGLNSQHLFDRVLEDINIQ